MTTALSSQQALMIAALLDYHDLHTLDAAELQLAVRYVQLADQFGVCIAANAELLVGLVARKRGRRAARKAFAGTADGERSSYSARKSLEYAHRLIKCSRSLTRRTNPRTGRRMFTPWRVELVLDTSMTIPFAFARAAEWLAALLDDATLTSTERYVALQLAGKLDYSGRLDTTRKGLAGDETKREDIARDELAEGITHVERKTAIAALDHLQARGLLSWSDDKTQWPRVITIRAIVPAAVSAAAPSNDDDSGDYDTAAIVTGEDDHGDGDDDDGYANACAAELVQPPATGRVITDAVLDYTRPDGQVLLFAAPLAPEPVAPIEPETVADEPEPKPARFVITGAQLDNHRFDDELRALCAQRPGPHRVELMLLGGGRPFGLLDRSDHVPVRIAWPDAAFHTAVSALRDVAPAPAAEPEPEPASFDVTQRQFDNWDFCEGVRALAVAHPGPHKLRLMLGGRCEMGLLHDDHKTIIRIAWPDAAFVAAMSALGDAVPVDALSPLGQRRADAQRRRGVAATPAPIAAPVPATGTAPAPVAVALVPAPAAAVPAPTPSESRPSAVRIAVTPEQLADPSCLRKLRAAIGVFPGPMPISLSVTERSAVGERTVARVLPLMTSTDGAEQMQAAVIDELKAAVARWRHEWEQEQRRVLAQHERQVEGEQAFCASCGTPAILCSCEDAAAAA